VVAREIVLRRPSGAVVVDVTSLIGAEEYIISQNRSLRPEDPFARQCFVEMVQSIILMPRVYVVHPVLLEPTIGDYGQWPLLLRFLLDDGLVLPLALTAEERSIAAGQETRVLDDLGGAQGLEMLTRFSEQALQMDRRQGTVEGSLSARMRLWTEFQDRRVRNVAGHHLDRIPTADGVENDQFGEWARAAAVVLRRPLQQLVPGSEGKYLLAMLARGLKYRARVDAAGLAYQSHPLRRDFSVAFDLMQDGASDNLIYRVVGSIRGIQESMASAVSPHERIRFELLELELPLLGGRLWHDSERGQLSDTGWVRGVATRIGEYRRRAADLRKAVTACVTDEDYLRLARDIEEVKMQLLERIGLRQVDLSPVEKDLVAGVASVIEAAPGVPKVSGLWFGARTLGKQVGFHGGSPFQRFLYREFVGAWKRAGR
jgi:hypothetical protein